MKYNIVAIIGSDCAVVPWYAPFQQPIVCPQVTACTGIIITLSNNRYILAPAREILGYQSLLCFEATRKGILVHNVRIAYHQLAYDVAIFTSHNSTRLKKKTSYFIDSINTMHCMSTCDPGNIECVTSDLVCDDANKVAQFCQQLYYVDSSIRCVCALGHMPASNICQVYIDMVHTTSNMHGAILQKHGELFGMIIGISDGNYMAVPANIMHSILRKYIDSIGNTHVHDLPQCPFNYIVKSRQIIIDRGCNLKLSNSVRQLRKGDIINKIDDYTILEQDGNAMVYCDDSRIYTLKNYIQLVKKHQQITELTITRIVGNSNCQKKIAFDTYARNNAMKYSPMCGYSACAITFANMNGIIIAELSHELLHVFAKLNVTLTCQAVQDYFKTGIGKAGIYLIVDCISQHLAQQYNLPVCQFSSNNHSKLDAWCITSINGQKIKLFMHNYINKHLHRVTIRRIAAVDSSNTKRVIILQD